MEDEYRLFQGPAWRWKLAEKIAARSGKRWPGYIDWQVREAADYRRALAAGCGAGAKTPGRFAVIDSAKKLAADPKLGSQCKILVLAGCPRAEVVSRLQVPPDVERTWEELFFDVRTALEATDWIFLHVIRPEQAHGLPSLASKMKLAYIAGPVAAQAVLDLDNRIPLTAGERLFDRKLRLHLKADEAADMVISSATEALRFYKVYAALHLGELRIRLETAKLQQRCRECLARQSREREEHDNAKPANSLRGSSSEDQGPAGDGGSLGKAEVG
jgi:hypothetical protein